MNWISPVIVITLDLVVIFVHILAVTLLARVKQNSVKGTQKMLLIALCVTELIYALIDILGHNVISWNWITGQLCFMYFIQQL